MIEGGGAAADVEVDRFPVAVAVAMGEDAVDRAAVGGGEGGGGHRSVLSGHRR